MKVKITKAKLFNNNEKIARHFMLLSTKIARARYGIVQSIVSALNEIPLSVLLKSWKKNGSTTSLSNFA